MMRNIHPDLFDYIEARLNHEPTQGQDDPRRQFIRAALALNGIREKTGHNDGRLVELIQATIGAGGDGAPWCMSLVQSCLAYVEKKLGVVSPIFASEHCLTVWRETPEAQRVKSVPLPGAIIIWKHGTTDQGHTGITLTPPNNNSFHALEGNTEQGLAESGRIEREGGGCYLTSRSMLGAGSMHLVGFLKPFALV